MIAEFDLYVFKANSEKLIDETTNFSDFQPANSSIHLLEN